MYYYWMSKLFCYKHRILLKILTIIMEIGTLITFFISLNMKVTIPLLIICCLLVLLCIYSRLDYFDPGNISAAFRVKSRNCRKIIKQINDKILELDKHVEFSFKEYRLVRVVSGATYRNGVRRPKSELFVTKLVNYDNYSIYVKSFQTFDRCGCNHIFLNEFFYKTVTKDDKAELERILFQII